MFDLNGQLVEQLFEDKSMPMEANSIKFYAHNIPSGTYICQVKDKEGNKLQEKMIKVD
ncbi:MAG: T9SS type A sorting domain-containing protein [Sphingobacteriales bacterium]|nr:T9SS type A sorting domain-containing protein [Sphingobacteriales bacterium]